MSVPFIYDSCGKWEVGGSQLDEWNVLFYASNPKINTQFDIVSNKDSSFYLNSVTPQKGNESVSRIYFKRIK